MVVMHIKSQQLWLLTVVKPVRNYCMKRDELTEAPTLAEVSLLVDAPGGK